MKKVLFILVAVCCGVVAFSQPDTALNRCLSSFIKANSRMDFEKVLDYTYPKLFSIAPRDQMLDLLKKTFDNEQMTIKLDSPQIDFVYPVFQLQKGSFAKILYSMKMMMIFKTKEIDTAGKKEKNELMFSTMKSKFGEKEVRMDSNGNIIVHIKFNDGWCKG
jgi:hypothetical protein